LDFRPSAGLAEVEVGVVAVWGLREMVVVDAVSSLDVRVILWAVEGREVVAVDGSASSESESASQALSSSARVWDAPNYTSISL
jgi:hypothetical protein